MGGVIGRLSTGIKPPHRKEVNMKKVIILTLLLVFGIASVGYSATNWSKFESGTNNIRVDGYQGQPGYIAFTDGNGTILGYIWMNSSGELVYCTKAAIDLTTTKLNDAVGVLLK